MTATVVRPGAPGRSPDRDQSAGPGLDQGHGVGRCGVGRQRLQRLAPRGRGDRPAGAGVLIGQCRGHGRGDVDRRRVGGQQVHDAELAQPGLGVLVTGRVQPDDCDPGRGEPGQGVPVEPAQVSREQGAARGAGGRGGEQVREVDAAADDRDAGRGALQAGDQRGLPAGAGDRGEDRDAHVPDDRESPADTCTR